MNNDHNSNSLEYQQKTWCYNQKHGSDSRSLYTSHTSRAEYMRASAYVHREDIPMVYTNAIFDLSKVRRSESRSDKLSRLV